MAELTESKKRDALSGWPMILGWLAMLIFACHASTHMVGAGDTWVAMACGRHFINHGVDTVEPFSANSHKAGPTPEEIKTWPGWAEWMGTFPPPISAPERLASLTPTGCNTVVKPREHEPHQSGQHDPCVKYCAARQLLSRPSGS